VTQTDAARLGIVTGLAFEAAILDRQFKKLDVATDYPDIRIVGADAARADRAAREMIEAGVTALMSFGVAGALDPVLASGDLVIPAGIIGPDGESLVTDENWTARLTNLVKDQCNVVAGDLAGSDGTVTTPAAKHELFRATGAGAVDMESLAVARAAQEHRLPFCAVRAIADPAQREIPAWAPGAISADGRTRPMAVLSGMFSRSGQIGNLVRLARESQAAKATLSRVALLGAPGFGLF
jgi:adenosylhomocysteine nucleosidase